MLDYRDVDVNDRNSLQSKTRTIIDYTPMDYPKGN